MDTRARRAILATIDQHGPISFAEYMDLALYGRGGFYERPPVGEHRAFVTSPHVHAVFGELLARAIRQLWGALEEPGPMRIVEVGGGDGTLAAQLLQSSEMPPSRYDAVERTEGARAALNGLDGVTVVDDIPANTHMVLAHELLDDLPFRRIRMGEAGPAEVRVGAEGDRLVEVLGPIDPHDPDVAVAVESLRPGGEAVVPDGALAFVDRLANRLGRAYALLIDYGEVGSAGGAPHGYRDQRVVDDVFDLPGTADITSGVDFALIADRAATAGLVPFPSVTQRRALNALGLQDWLRSELSRQQCLLDDGHAAEAVRTWSGRSRATLLVDPSALGRFRWLLIATPGLPAPPWLTAAAAPTRADA
jgi:NADH dehydrogenase [ubiquinone] 1 alpha subcomplex assembly factor 7